MTATVSAAKKKRAGKTSALRRKEMSREEKAEWRKVVEAAYGCLAGVDYSVDEYLREKHAEVERENKE